MTNDIDAIRQREQAAEPAPWRVVEEHGRDIADEAYSRLTIQTADPSGSREIAELVDPDHSWSSKLTEENAEFIAHARTDVPALLAKVDELTAKIEDRRKRLVEAESDLLDVRGILSPNGYPQRVPVDLVPTVDPAVRWLADQVDELTAALIDEQASHQATLRNQSALSAEVQQLRAELEKTRDQLTAANRRADGAENDLNSATKANTAWVNQDGAAEPLFLIWSNHHQAWWAPNSRGYRSNVNDAGRFTFADAQRELHRGCGCCRVPEVPVLAELTAGAGEEKLRSVIAVATRAAIEYGQVNKCYEPVAEVAP